MKQESATMKATKGHFCFQAHITLYLFIYDRYYIIFDLVSVNHVKVT